MIAAQTRHCEIHSDRSRPTRAISGAPIRPTITIPAAYAVLCSEASVSLMCSSSRNSDTLGVNV